MAKRVTEPTGPLHVILIIANHFEPGYNEEPNEHGGQGITLDWSVQLARLDSWYEQARAIGTAVHDHDGTPFRHTNFYPAEQYHRRLLDRLADLQADGLGEVEIHLHHGVDRPDTAENFRRTLVDFRDALAQEHKCLSRAAEDDRPRYAFVHGNWALANSAGGRFCGVDSEMQILADTGCYADLTLPSAPDQSQVARINAIYQSKHSLEEARPHRSGPGVRVGEHPREPVMITGPLLFDWERRKFGFLPGLDNSALTAKYPLSVKRLGRLINAHIGVIGKPDWVFIKLYCHGFFDYDQAAIIGEPMRVGLQETLEYAEKTGLFRIHFATAREAYNMVLAAVDGEVGEPGRFRDYKLKQVMNRSQKQVREINNREGSMPSNEE